MLSVKAQVRKPYAGRNRAGMFFPGGVWVTVPDEMLKKLTPAQLDGLLSDPLLDVREGEPPVGIADAALARRVGEPATENDQAPVETGPDYGQCEETTTKGRRCRNKATESGFCAAHTADE